MSIAVLWNARAGSAARASLDDVRRRLGDPLIYELAAGRSAASCVRDALARAASIVVAAGGDGTVSAVAGALAGSPAALGVLPLGTANSCAAALDIPAELDAALALLEPSRGAPAARAIDLAQVTGAAGRRVMILHCMVGFHADTIASTTTDAKRRWGVLAYAASALRELAQLAPFDVELATPDHVIRCEAIAVGAANLAPARSVLAHGPSHVLGDDGKLDVTVIAARSIAEAVATGLHLYRSARGGEPARRDNVGSFATPRVEIRAAPAQQVLVDGEPFGDTPVTVETLPRALRVIAPPVATDAPADAPLDGLPGLEIRERGA